MSRYEEMTAMVAQLETLHDKIEATGRMATTIGAYTLSVQLDLMAGKVCAELDAMKQRQQKAAQMQLV
jgi:hypothetical protein